jgi:hypothetical protein
MACGEASGKLLVARAYSWSCPQLGKSSTGQTFQRARSSAPRATGFPASPQVGPSATSLTFPRLASSPPSPPSHILTFQYGGKLATLGIVLSPSPSPSSLGPTALGGHPPRWASRDGSTGRLRQTTAQSRQNAFGRNSRARLRPAFAVGLPQKAKCTLFLLSESSLRVISESPEPPPLR